jgi:hypothetical protein
VKSVCCVRNNTVCLCNAHSHTVHGTWSSLGVLVYLHFFVLSYNYFVQLTQQWIWTTIQMMEYLERTFSEFWYFLFIYSGLNFKYGYCMLPYCMLSEYRPVVVAYLFSFFTLRIYSTNVFYIYSMPFMSNDQTIGFIKSITIKIYKYGHWNLLNTGQHVCQHMYSVWRIIHSNRLSSNDAP